MPIGKFTIAIAQLLWCCGEDGNSATRLFTNARSQLSATLAVEFRLKNGGISWGHKIDLTRVNAVASLHRAMDRYIFHRRRDFRP